jgi:hypothetical protein
MIPTESHPRKPAEALSDLFDPEQEIGSLFVSPDRATSRNAIGIDKRIAGSAGWMRNPLA